MCFGQLYNLNMQYGDIEVFIMNLRRKHMETVLMCHTTELSPYANLEEPDL